MAIGARRITNKGQRKLIGKFPSLKMKTAVWWESQIERDFIYFLEIDPDVLSFYSQPFHISYWFDGKEHSYTPDFFVERVGRKQVVEIKPEKKVSKPENQIIFQKVSPICFQQGYEFIVITDKTIRLQPRLNNIKLLHKYSRIPIYPQYQILFQEFFLNKQSATFGQAEDFLEQNNVCKQVIYGLIYWGILTIDLMVPINKESIISSTSK